MVDCQPSKRTAADDLVDAVDDVLDDDRGLVPLQGLEQLGERGLALLLAGDLVDGLLRRDGVAGQFQQLAEEVEAGLLDVGVLLPQRVEALAELDEDRVVEVAGDPGGDLLLDLLDRSRRCACRPSGPRWSARPGRWSRRPGGISTWTCSLIRSMVLAPRACQTSRPVMSEGRTDSYTSVSHR